MVRGATGDERDTGGAPPFQVSSFLSSVSNHQKLTHPYLICLFRPSILASMKSSAAIGSALWVCGVFFSTLQGDKQKDNRSFFSLKECRGVSPSSNTFARAPNPFVINLLIDFSSWKTVCPHVSRPLPYFLFLFHLSSWCFSWVLFVGAFRGCFSWVTLERESGQRWGLESRVGH